VCYCCGNIGYTSKYHIVFNKYEFFHKILPRFLAASLKTILYLLLHNVTVAYYLSVAYVCVYVLSSITLVHPAKAVRRNEMPFGRDTRVVPSNAVLDRGPGFPYEKGRFVGRNPSDSSYCQIIGLAVVLHFLPRFFIIQL